MTPDDSVQARRRRAILRVAAVALAAYAVTLAVLSIPGLVLIVGTASRGYDPERFAGIIAIFIALAFYGYLALQLWLAAGVLRHRAGVPYVGIAGVLALAFAGATWFALVDNRGDVFIWLSALVGVFALAAAIVASTVPVR
jgi:hypothetical protein